MTQSDTVIDLTQDTFMAAVAEDPSPILIDFWAPWCGPCRMMKPILEEAARQLAGSVRVAKINVDEEPGIANAFGIRGIPTLILISDGRIHDSFTGALPGTALTERIRQRLGISAKE